MHRDLDADPLQPVETDPLVATVRREICGVYRDLVASVATIADDSAPTSDAGTTLPFERWERADESSRAVPALVALAHEVPAPDPADARAVTRVLVGLDALVTALDEFVDTATLDRDERTALAATLALAARLAFSAVPDPARAAAVSSELSTYLLETARIPAVEGSLRERLAGTEGDETLAALRSVYAARARDVTAFASVPAIVYGLDSATTDRLAADLRTHRAHSLLFDDVRDVARDRRDGIQTPVRWLLATEADLATVTAHLESLSAAFDYSGAGYCESLRALEAAPADLRGAVAAARELA